MDFTYITPHVDIALMTLMAFWLFFVGLVIYLRREDSREGYPLETDIGGRVRRPNWLFLPKPKEFKLPHGEGSYFAPPTERDTRDIKAERTAPWPGAAYTPIGEPMDAAVGAGAYAERAKVTDKTVHGDHRLVPLRNLGEYSVARESRDPRGFPVFGTDNKQAGTISDIWVDKAECSARHLEMELAGEGQGGTVIVPLSFARIELERNRVKVEALYANQFLSIPRLQNSDEITRDEEERIQSYYGAGTRYANERRSEPLV